MAQVVKFFKTIRNNWKKTIFFSGVAAYGVHFGKSLYEDSLVRQAYCEEAKIYGNEPIKTGERARRVTVFFNPAARNGKSRKLFEKNVAPVLYLAGMEVTVVKTEYEGQVKKFMEVIEDTDAIVVAGGNGTLLEVVTGLLRRPDQEKMVHIPIGFIPLGTANTLGKCLYGDDQSEVTRLVEAALSVVKGRTKQVDVMHIKGDENKNVFALSNITWGPFREAEIKKPKYWYLGPLKERIPWLKACLTDWPPAIQAKLTYILPCDGCSTCYTPPPTPTWRWWHIFLPPKQEVVKEDFSNVTNVECGQLHEKDVTTMEFVVNTHNDSPDKNDKGVNILLGPETMSKSAFIKEGWRRIKEGPSPDHFTVLPAQHFHLIPTIQEGSTSWFSFDHEHYELMPIEVELLRKRISVFIPDKEHPPHPQS